MSVLFVLIAIAFASLVVTPVMAQQAKVTATTTTTSEIYESGPLDVFGNANEDDTIDMRDTTYIKLVIFGKKPKTDLADANYDGKVSMLDVGQTKLIILGKEKELTVIDDTGEAVTVHKPVKRLVLARRSRCFAEALRAINAADKIVGVDTDTTDEKIFFPELSKLPCPGTDYEAILNLNPDLYTTTTPGKVEGLQENLPSITVICLKLYAPIGFPERVRKLGYIVDKREEAEEYIKWHETWLNVIKEMMEKVPEDEKRRVFYGFTSTLEGGYKVHVTSGGGQMLEFIPCENMGKDIPGGGGHPVVDTEWIMEQDPEVFIMGTYNLIPTEKLGYNTDDFSEIAAARESLVKRPEIAYITAGKTGRVFIECSNPLSYSGSYIIGIIYLAKMIYPDHFTQEVTPQVLHQEYLTRFQHIDFNVYEHGVFVYPPLEK